MSLNRRDLLTGLGGVAATAALSTLGAQLPSGDALAGGSPPSPTRPGAPEFPRKADFNIADGYTYINGAYTHPMPRVAAEAARRAAESRGTLAPPAGGGGRGGGAGGDAARSDPKALFAKLINAKPTEISYVPNTST